MVILNAEKNTWDKVSKKAREYLETGGILYQAEKYTLWVRSVGSIVIEITKAGPNQKSLPTVENDGGRITTFETSKENINDFINRIESIQEDDYTYSDQAYKILTSDITSTPIENLQKEILSLISDDPMGMSDFRAAIKERGKITFTDADEEETGHGRKRWKTNLQNAVQNLKSKGKIGHLRRDQYISPIKCQNPLAPDEFWIDILENARLKDKNVPIADFTHNIHGTGEYYIQSVSNNEIVFRREPLSGDKKVDFPKFNKSRIEGMANSLNAVGGKGTRVTIGGNRELYAELLVPLSLLIDLVDYNTIIIIDTVIDSDSPFVCNESGIDKDLRRRAKKPGVQREGARKFRKDVLENYGGKCAISGTSVEDVIQAAHIRPYNGPETNHPANGIALRSDIHRLFDLFKIRINPIDLSVHLHPEISSEYSELWFEKLDLPPESIRPDENALQPMWDMGKNRWF